MPKLDRVPFLHEDNKKFPIRPLLAPRRPYQVDRVWRMPRQMPLNQGEEGACVGFGWCTELASEPVQYDVNNDYAFRYYSAARRQDVAMGNNFPDGASVLAGAKVAKATGMVSQYRWAFGIDDVVDTLIQKGPVVLGLNWYESMYETDRQGRVTVSGALVGGHCITAYGFHPNHPTFGPCVRWMNTWGPTYGLRGVGYITVPDLTRLLKENGEACIPTDVVARR